MTFDGDAREARSLEGPPPPPGLPPTDQARGRQWRVIKGMFIAGVVLLALALTIAWGGRAVGLWGAGRARAPGFSQAASLLEPRAAHTATLLGDGRVLVVGGLDGNVAPLSTMEVYDPSSGRWSRVGSLPSPLSMHTATRLLDGRILIAGGRRGDAPTADAFLFDPSTASLDRTGPLQSARELASATLLADGRVLIVGGEQEPGDETLARYEVYDPARGSFSAGSLREPRTLAALALLDDGRVLITGGSVADGPTSTSLRTTEFFIPGQSTTEPGPTMREPRVGHTATKLRDGRVLIVGAPDGPNSAEIFDPRQDALTSAGALDAWRNNQSATLLTNGRVLILGGSADGVLASAEVYDPVRGEFSEAGALRQARYFHTATLLLDGHLLVTGGWPGLSGGSTSSVELWSP